MVHQNARVNEYDVSVAVLRVLSGIEGGRARIAQLVRECPNYLDLSAADLATSTTRPNEAVWEQLVRNITSHHAAEGNFIREGYLERVPGGLAITESGRAWIKKKG